MGGGNIDDNVYPQYHLISHNYQNGINCSHFNIKYQDK